MKIINHRGFTEVHFSDSLPSPFIKGLDLSSTLFLIDDQLLSLFSVSFGIPLNDLTHVVTVPSSENSKSVSYLSALLERIYNNNATPTRLISFGGGTLQDISGYLAGLIRRGIEWIYIPTTLLSMADSSIGSKISINVGTKKNQIGFFYAPSVIYVFPSLLQSLPEREYISGCGDILHYALQSSVINPIFTTVLPRIFLDPTPEEINQVIRATLEIKKIFVEEDEFDVDLRKSLNLGHSFAHAIETASSFAIPHGIAVILGCSLAFHLSLHKKILNKELYLTHLRLIGEMLLCSSKYFDSLYIDEVLFRDALSFDKKNIVSGHALLILPSGLSNSDYCMKRINVPVDEVSEFLSTFLADSCFSFEALGFS